MKLPFNFSILLFLFTLKPILTVGKSFVLHAGPIADGESNCNIDQIKKLTKTLDHYHTAATNTGRAVKGLRGTDAPIFRNYLKDATEAQVTAIANRYSVGAANFVPPQPVKDLHQVTNSVLFTCVAGHRNPPFVMSPTAANTEISLYSNFFDSKANEVRDISSSDFFGEALVHVPQWGGSLRSTALVGPANLLEAPVESRMNTPLFYRILAHIYSKRPNFFKNPHKPALEKHPLAGLSLFQPLPPIGGKLQKRPKPGTKRIKKIVRVAT